MSKYFGKKCTSALACFAIVILGAIIIWVWVQFGQGAFKDKQQHSILNISSTQEAVLMRVFNGTRHQKELIEKTHLGDIGPGSDVEFVKPLRIFPESIRAENESKENPVLRHHNGHFRHKITGVWERHPQYEIEAFGRKMFLDLDFNEKFTPNLLVISHFRNNTNQKINNDPRVAGCFYTGKIRGDKESSVTLSLCGGMTGYIQTSDSSYYIEPAEEYTNTTTGSLIHRIKKFNLFQESNDVASAETPEFFENIENNTVIEDAFYDVVDQPKQHIIRKRQTHRDQFPLNVDEEIEGTCDVVEEENWKTEDQDERSRTTRDAEWASNQFFVNVLIVADKSMLEFHHSYMDLQHYILMIMHHVSLLFKHETIGNAITVHVGSTNILPHEQDFSKKKSEDMLHSFCRWQKDYIKDSNEYNVAILLTRNVICGNKSTDPSHCLTLGVASVGTMCQSGCAIVRDKGLSSSFVIAHEIGHILSMVHDEDKKCEPYNNWKTNHIMSSTITQNTKPFTWSNCSKHFISEFLGSHRAHCLKRPIFQYADFSYTDMLPGDKVNLSVQCELEFGKGYQFYATTDQPPCEHLLCVKSGEMHYPTTFSPWADGTKCGPKRVCFNGECKLEQEIIPIDGGWGVWNAWGPCSRTCGGGIKRSYRDCNAPKPKYGGRYCIGDSIRYESCNTQDCDPGGIDFRVQQCAVFSNSTVEWYPDFNLEYEEDWCGLYCLPNKNKPREKKKSKVIDGTKCNITGFGICVNGDCRQGGCDNKLGSMMQLDDCGICGGDNSKCQEISGTYNKSSETDGYYTVVKIPKGSSNLNITQDSYPVVDQNYLVLRDAQTNEFLLNGNHNVKSHEYRIKFGDVEITYSGSSSPREWIISPKNQKLPGDLILEVLTGGKMSPPNIYYQYLINKEDAPSFGWRLYDRQWSKCNSICDGKQFRKPVCVDLVTGIVMAKSYCDNTEEFHIQKQECNNHCELTWNILSKSACTPSCGKGLRHIYYNCMKISKKKQNHREVVNDRNCFVLPKPQLSESCQTLCNTTRWHYTPWSKCSKSCDGGLQTRTAKCIDESNTRIDSSYCMDSEMILEQNCNTESCHEKPPEVFSYQNPHIRDEYDNFIIPEPYGSYNTFKWVSGNWSQCSRSCGGGIMQKEFYCRDEMGNENSNMCSYNSRPKDVKECNNFGCPRWKTGNWSPSCNTNCEKLRQVRCIDHTNAMLTDEYCDQQTKPSNSIKCKSYECSATNHIPRTYFTPRGREIKRFRWKVGPWKRCSNTCGKGTRRRHVECIDSLNDFVVVDQFCDKIKKPKMTRQCEKYACKFTWMESYWSTCSKSCGSGIKTRNVTCHRVQRGGIIDPVPISSSFQSSQINMQNYCSFSNKPSAISKCVVSYCGDEYMWQPESWKECSHRCGRKGRQTRVLNCVSARNKEKVPRYMCRRELKPPRKRKCNQLKCSFKSCAEIKHYTKTKENKDYIISLKGRPVQVYCYKMDTPHPQEYISLHPDKSNFAEMYDKRLIDVKSCPNHGLRDANCPCHDVGLDRSGFTKFWKIRLNVTSMQIIGDDYTFSRQIKGSQVPYGSAGDCYSSVSGCVQGQFSVDLSQTSFKLSTSVRWEKLGSSAVMYIHRSETSATGTCGGNCGNCIPDPSVGLAVEIT